MSEKWHRIFSRKRVCCRKGRVCMTQSIIRFEHVTKKYGEKVILNDFCMNVQKGEFITIIGSSGCGKTTVLKMVNGLKTPTDGQVFVWEKDVSQMDPIALRRKIGYVIQGTGLFPHMNIFRNIAYVPNLIGKQDKEDLQKLVERLIETVGLEKDMLSRYPSELSGGQCQRVGIARALAATPDIMLMDEPFGAVDEITRKMLQNEILRIYRDLGMTILFVTHDIQEALKLGTRVLVMDKGKLLQFGTPQEITEKPNTEFVRRLVCEYNNSENVAF